MTDILITNSGELEIGNTGDLSTVSENDEIAQNILFRLKTVAGDFLIQPQCGASLESLIGKPNNEDTGTLMEMLIINALTHDGYLTEYDINIEVFPISTNEIVAIIVVSTETGDPVQVSASVDLREGKVTETRIS